MKIDRMLRRDSPRIHPLRDSFSEMNLNTVSERKTLVGLERIIQLIRQEELKENLEEIFLGFFESDPGRVAEPRCNRTRKAGKRWMNPGELPDKQKAVSYTHLTLPTKA